MMDVTEIGQDIEFNSDGSAMFLMIDNNSDRIMGKKHYLSISVYQKILTFLLQLKLVDFKWVDIFQKWNDDQSGDRKGFGFSSDGMKLFIVEQRSQWCRSRSN